MNLWGIWGMKQIYEGHMTFPFEIPDTSLQWGSFSFHRTCDLVESLHTCMYLVGERSCYVVSCAASSLLFCIICSRAHPFAT